MAEHLYLHRITPDGKLRLNAKHDDAIPPDEYTSLVSKMVSEKLNQKLKLTNGEMAMAIAITNRMAPIVGTIPPDTMADILHDVFTGKPTKEELIRQRAQEGLNRIMSGVECLASCFRNAFETSGLDDFDKFTLHYGVAIMDPHWAKDRGLPVDNCPEESWANGICVVVTEMELLCELSSIPKEEKAILAKKMVAIEGKGFVAFNFDTTDGRVAVTTAVLAFS